MLERDEEAIKAKECLNIIQFKPNGKEYQNRQAARADANEKLQITFGIDNGFTTQDEKSRHKFLMKAERLVLAAMHTAQRGRSKESWIDLRSSDIANFDEYMQDADESSINLSVLIQYITLKQSLCYLFEDANEALKVNESRFDDIKYIGHRINKL
jgi:lipopolysaccharide export LptBFGC system permease protein LptF